MKEMKSLKQQMTAALSLILMVMVITVCAPDQALANGKGRKGGSASVQQRNNARQPRRITISSKGFEAGYTLNFEEFRHNNLSVNAGRRRNLVGSPEYFNRTNQPNHFYGTGVYKNSAYRSGSFAKARNKQGH